MRLHEYEAKEILSRYEIRIPEGGLATSLSRVREIATELHPPLMVKAQVLVSGRGKAGGILFANSPSEAETVAKRLLGAEIKASKVRFLLVEEKLSVKRELYFGVTVDRSNQCYVAMASSTGGMEIEEVAVAMPEKIIRFLIHPLDGFHSHDAVEIARKLGYSNGPRLKLAAILGKLYQVAMDYDGELVEMNPLVETVSGDFVAADARLIVDNNALYRHPELEKRLREQRTEASVLEMKARQKGLAYVKLEGNVGVIGNGAGLVMATLDTIQLHGGKPANFLDVGGGASMAKVAAALDIVFSDPEVSTIFVNILGGITRCDEVAKGILMKRKRSGFVKPIVIRLVGTNEEEGRRVLREAGVPVMDSMEDAAEKAVELAIRRG
ncbi:MAG: ADP-forming succinate--CoA ligase subunit beta [Candidatus Bathyarchaeota archaeon]|nr:MAG: ADP-forming succinate--CoA ligase subunit beta [Candidatus Bathyarchaeota archaeon]